MDLNLQNLKNAKKKLNNCDVSAFTNVEASFKFFTLKLHIVSFRHLSNLGIDFSHPVSVISGTNKIGKTSILILLACSHEKFMKIDSTSPNGGIREHVWKDVINFTKHESDTKEYSYKMQWRVGNSPVKNGEGKRLATSKAWSGLGKKSSARDRVNAKIRDREVRMIDLERILPARSFSNALFRKANAAGMNRLADDIEKAFAYLFDLTSVEIYEAGRHVNRSCFFISTADAKYSSYNAASGEESAIYLLQDIFGAEKNSLILIDEIEAGFHPMIQRKLADVIQYVSWRDKKQFVITTHSPAFISAFSSKSRIFIESDQSGFRVIPQISTQAVSSKMDSISYPLLTLYCEDDLAYFLIKKVIGAVSAQHKMFGKLIQIIKSGSIDQVKNDYIRHQRNFNQMRNKIGYGAVFDGDHKDHPNFSHFFKNSLEFALFLFPYEAPEKFLVRSFLKKNPNPELSAALTHTNHHDLFSKMVSLEMATDVNDARNLCYEAFKESPEYPTHEHDLKSFLIGATKYFSILKIDEEQEI